MLADIAALAAALAARLLLTGLRVRSALAVVARTATPWGAGWRPGTTSWISVQPGSRYWLFQGAQAALLLATAGALAGLAVWLMCRRTA